MSDNISQTGPESHTDVKPVDRRLVHKLRDENVFIGNLRRAIPRTLPYGEYQKLINHYNITQTENSYLLSCYSPLPNQEGNVPFYILKSIPETLSITEMKSAVRNSSLSPDNIKRVLRLYRKKRNCGYYYLSAEPNAPESRLIGILLGNNADHLSDAAKCLLSDIFERCGMRLNENYFRANMIVDTNHQYFFEHPNEHVPGMMIVEAARQFLLACTHKYGRVPLEGYKFIMSNLIAEFNSYLELNHPVIMSACQTECFEYNRGMWADTAFDVSVLQNGSTSTIMKFRFNVVSERVFNRIRSGGHHKH